MRIPVVAYSLVLCGMGISAMLADLGTPLAGFGALLFIAAVAMIAISKFRHPFPYSQQLVWITYCAAQFFILRAVECRHSRDQRTPQIASQTRLTGAGLPIHRRIARLLLIY